MPYTFNEFVNFSENLYIFSEFSCIFENIVFQKKKNQGYNGETVSSIIRKILKCDIKIYNKNTSNIRKV